MWFLNHTEDILVKIRMQLFKLKVIKEKCKNFSFFNPKIYTQDYFFKVQGKNVASIFITFIHLL